MRLPQLRLRTLIAVVLVVGLVLGNYASILRQVGANSTHSYGYTAPHWQIMLMAVFGVAVDLLVVGLAFGAMWIGWRTMIHRRGRTRR